MTSAAPYAEVIGDPVSHSKSPLIHRFWLKKLGLDYEYRATRVTFAELPEFFEGRRSDPLWCGCNVTMPLKIAALGFLDERSEEVRMIGATNTITRLSDDARLVGHNTDWIGVHEPLSRWMESDGFFVADLIGTGGAAAAAMVALKQRRAATHITNYGRTHESALAFRRRFDDEQNASAPISHLAGSIMPLSEPSLLINASPLGMRGHPPLALDLTDLAPGSIVFDMVYDPLETDLLRSARERGLVGIDGLTMLVGQAAAAFEHFFGIAAPREHDPELRELLTA